jgi:hypothetical protein
VATSLAFGTWRGDIFGITISSRPGPCWWVSCFMGLAFQRRPSIYIYNIYNI